MNCLNKENLFPNSIETRCVPTPRSRGMRKYVRILSKIHQMRFMLIQKLKDSKILFEIIDENFNSRARINSLKVTNNKMNSEYKTNRMYDIFKPTISDLTDGYGPLEDSEIQPTSRSKASEIKEFKEEQLRRTSETNYLKLPEINSHKRSKSKNLKHEGDADIDELIKAIVKQQIEAESASSSKDITRSKNKKSRKSKKCKNKTKSTSIINQENIIIDQLTSEPPDEEGVRLLQNSKDKIECLSANISKARSKYTAKMSYVHSLNTVINSSLGYLKNSIMNYYEK